MTFLTQTAEAQPRFPKLAQAATEFAAHVARFVGAAPLPANDRDRRDAGIRPASHDPRASVRDRIIRTGMHV